MEKQELFKKPEPVKAKVGTKLREGMTLSTIPGPGVIAFCSKGMAGLITHEGLQEVTYGGGAKGMAYIGVHLHNHGDSVRVGDPWSSSSPRPICRIEQLIWKVD